MLIRGVDLHTQISHQGTPFIWGHGLMSSIEAEDRFDWLRWQQMPEAIQLIRYDARGHGSSAPSFTPEDYQWRNLAQDMLALADGVGAARFIAGGASMGCVTALHAALLAPQRIKALVLVIPPTVWETRVAQKKLYRRVAMLGALLGADRLEKLMNRDLARALPDWMAQVGEQALAGRVLGMRALKRKTLWNLFQGAALSDLPPREDLKALADIPTLLVAWVGDTIHPVSSAQELHRLLPQSELFVAQGYEDFTTIPERVRAFVTAHA